MAAELGGELIAPLITIDSRIAITPKNAKDEIIQEFMSAKNAILRVTPDGRVGLQAPRGVSLLGFDEFLQMRGVDVSDPHALDAIQQQVVLTSDPLTLAKRNHVRGLRKALKRKDWDAPAKRRVSRQAIAAAPVVEIKKDDDENNTPKLRAVMLMLFNIYKQTDALVNDYIVGPIKFVGRSIYANGIRPIINFIFGKIDYQDEYQKAQDDLRTAIPVEVKQAIVTAPSDTPSNTAPQMLLRQSNSKKSETKFTHSSNTLGTTFTTNTTFSKNKLTIG